MKTLPILNQQQSKIVFSGLIGSRSSHTSGSNRGRYTSIFLNYYPFINEPESEIQDFVKKNSCYWMQGAEEKPYFYNSSVIVQNVLPFTQNEYDLYKNAKVSNRTKYKIEKSLDDAGLHKYISNKFKYFACKYTRLIKKILL